MKVIFTCGGTAGHVNPALALAGYLREKDASTEILFVGAERGLARSGLRRSGITLSRSKILPTPSVRQTPF